MVQGEGGEMQATNDILAMVSPEGENVSLGKGLKGMDKLKS